MLALLNGVGSTRMSAGQPSTYVTFQVPPGFNWDPDFDIINNGDGSYSTNYDPADDKPSGTTFYVDNVSGNDTTGNGSSGNPYASIQKALNENGVVINIKTGSGRYDNASNFLGFNNSRSIALVAIDGPGTVKFIGGKNGAALSWAQQSAPNDSVYLATVTSANMVIDETDTESYTLVDGATGVPKPLTPQTSIANAQANPGSYYITGSSVYVHTHDSRAPDADVNVLTTDAVFSGANVSTTTYLEGIEFWAKDAAAIDGENTTGAAKVIAVDCGFRYSPTVSAFKPTNMGFIALIRCKASHAYVDGFSVANTAVTSYYCRVLEEDCEARDCGRNPSGASNNNCSSYHEKLTGIRLNGVYDTSQGPIIADVLGAQSLNMNCSVSNPGSSTGGTHVSNSCYNTGSLNPYENNPAVIWVYGGSTAGSTGNDLGMSSGGIIFYDTEVTLGIGRNEKVCLPVAESYLPVLQPGIEARVDFSNDLAFLQGTTTIIQWRNDSPKTTDLSQFTSAKRPSAPAVVSGKYNGRKVVTIADGASSERGVNFAGSVTAKDVYFIVTYKDGADSSFDATTSLMGGDADIKGTSGTDALDTIGAGAFKTSAQTLIPTGDGAIIRITGDSAVTDNFSLFFDIDVANEGWTGTVMECLVYNTTRTTDQHNEIVAYATNKYNL